ncbi:hypothetical protein H2258_06510 [Campylobacter sp. RM9939]|uniref:hypothetical protein n=1 Tax=Campylobacter molothri TaxID=1032242 RepID=UPI00301E19EC|nr:hypothetical protein [Campylobacter sp. RM9939]
MSYTSCSFDNAYDEFEKANDLRDKELIETEINSNEIFMDIDIKLEELQNELLVISNDDDKTTALIGAYKDEFFNDMLDLLQNITSFKNKYKNLV